MQNATSSTITVFAFSFKAKIKTSIRYTATKAHKANRHIWSTFYLKMSSNSRLGLMEKASLHLWIQPSGRRLLTWKIKMQIVPSLSIPTSPPFKINTLVSSEESLKSLLYTCSVMEPSF